MTMKKVKYLAPTKARRIIDEFLTPTTIFTVEFDKKEDGSTRLMNCRRGVAKGVVGSGRKPSTETITVFDLQLGAHRSFRLDAIRSIKGGGVVFTPA